MRGFARRFARERAFQHGLHLVLRRGELAGRPRFVAQQAVQPLLGRALLPPPHRRAADTRLTGHLQHGQALVRQQHDPGTQDRGREAAGGRRRSGRRASRVFLPSSTGFNPSLTIVAQALRTAEHILKGWRMPEVAAAGLGAPAPVLA